MVRAEGDCKGKAAAQAENKRRPASPEWCVDAAQGGARRRLSASRRLAEEAVAEDAETKKLREAAERRAGGGELSMYMVVGFEVRPRSWPVAAVRHVEVCSVPTLSKPRDWLGGLGGRGGGFSRAASVWLACFMALPPWSFLRWTRLLTLHHPTSRPKGQRTMCWFGAGDGVQHQPRAARAARGDLVHGRGRRPGAQAAGDRAGCGPWLSCPAQPCKTGSP